MIKYPKEFINQVEELEVSVSNLLEVLKKGEPLNATMYDVKEKSILLSQEWIRKYHAMEFE